MTRRYHAVLILFLIAGLCGAQTAAAQITVTESDLSGQVGQSSSITSYTSTDVAGLQSIVDATGENQTYDFTNITVSDTMRGTVTYHDDAAGLPGGEAYPSSNYVMALELGVESAVDDSTVWIFNRIDDDALLTLGGAFVFENPDTGSQDTLAFAYDPPRFNYPLPFTYGDSWSDTTAFFGSEMRIESEVDGWGTLVTPKGSYDALRVRMTTISSTFGFTSTTHSLQFITKTSEASASISLGEDPATAERAEVVAWSVSTSAEDEELPQQVSLDQNYPNPFNPSTTFEYELESSRHVRLTVHDALGRTVAVLVDGVRPAGRHDVAFDASDLPSGTYMYRLQAGSVTRTKAMTVAK